MVADSDVDSAGRTRRARHRALVESTHHVDVVVEAHAGAVAGRGLHSHRELSSLGSHGCGQNGLRIAQRVQQIQLVGLGFFFAFLHSLLRPLVDLGLEFAAIASSRCSMDSSHQSQVNFGYADFEVVGVDAHSESALLTREVADLVGRGSQLEIALVAVAAAVVLLLVGDQQSWDLRSNVLFDLKSAHEA